MAFFKYELMLKYLGIKASITNPRTETIFGEGYNYNGFYMRYLNLDTNKEELAKVYVDPQRQMYKEIREIYKEVNDENSKIIKASLAAKLKLKNKDIFMYASYPVTKINDEVSTLCNFKVEPEPDKYYFDISGAKDIEGVLDFLEVDKSALGEFADDINYIVNFDAKTLEKCGLFYHIAGTSDHLKKLIAEAPFINNITSQPNLQTAFDVLVEMNETENPNASYYCIGLQVPYAPDPKLGYRTMKKFVFTSVNASEDLISFFAKK